jgi:hypothetical protein
MDNLNTHTTASLYEAFPPEEARSLAERLEIHYTGRSAVEHIFGFMENSMGGPRLEYIGQKRISAGIGLSNLTYNMRRYIQLVKRGWVNQQA